jgi:drug/metabolite transporter (DMT)-like permease
MTRTLLLIAACVVTNGAGQLLLRLGAMGAAPVTFDLATWVGLFSRWPIVAGLVLWGVSMIAWLAVLGRAELSYAYLFGSVNYVAVPLAAALLLGETLPRARLLGMVCILAGVLLVLHGGNRALVR